MLSHAQVNAVAELAEHLYDYLPGSSQWNAYTFESAAKAVGVGPFWPGGSKLPALTSLLESTMDHQQSKFVTLIETIVMEGLKYRRRRGNPVSREDILFVTKSLRSLGFPYSKLSNENFLDSLPSRATESPAVPKDRPAEASPPPSRIQTESELGSLRAEFLALREMPNRQRAGQLFEPFLSRLFLLFGLSPTKAFRVVGEQIDGGFVLDTHDYLLEAKWVAAPIAENDLLVFRGKVEAKSAFTRGLFVSVNGFTRGAVASIVQGKQPNFVMIDGAHIFRVLDGAIGFDDMLRMLVRHLLQEGRPYVPVSEL